MPVETIVWRVDNEKLIEVQKSALKSEAELHRWIEDNPKLISSDLLIIGSEVVTPHGGRIDLLGIDSAGTIHVIELKRDKTPRDVVSQALDYASWVADLGQDEIDKICRRYLNIDLQTAYSERFKVSPDSINEDHSITIVASELDPTSERIVRYLSEKHELNINAVFFHVFDDGRGQVLARSSLLDSGTVSARAERRAEKRERSDWTGFYFVNIGIGPEADRSWDDDTRFGIVTAGGGARWRDFMLKLQRGDRIFAYAKGRGYVGYGVVTRPAEMAKDYVLPNGERLLDQELYGTQLRFEPEDPDLAEYVVGVDWRSTVPLAQAKSFPQIFRIQQVVNKIYDEKTVEFLKREFKVE